MAVVQKGTIRWAISLLLVMLYFSGLTAQAQYGGGTGEPNDPYQIATVEDLLSIGNDPNLLDKHYILVADIDLDPNLPGGMIFTKALIAPNPVYPFRETSTTFTGCFDGNGYTIRNLLIDNSEKDDYLGIFGFIGSNGQVKNLRIENILIKGQRHNVGGLTGENWGTITDCHITGSVYGGSDVGGLVGKNGSKTAIRSDADAPPADDDSSGEYIEGTIIDCSADVDVAGGGTRYGYSIGGLAGGNSGGIISCCRSGGMATGERWVGGLVGSSSGRVENCYSNSNVQGHADIGGLVGSNFDSVLFCYSVGTVIGEERFGGLVGINKRSTYLCYWDVQASGIGSSKGGRGKTTEQMKDVRSFRGWGYEPHWTIDECNDYPRLAWEQLPGTPIIDIPCEYGGGSGDVNDPYQIYTEEQFVAVGYCWPDFDKHFVLINDIDLNKIDPNLVVPIGTLGIPFSGTFDGNNYTISNFRCLSTGENYIGAFGYLGPQGIIRNIVMSNTNINGNENVGALVGGSEGSILNCFVSGCVTGDRFVGGFVGSNSGDATISLCSSISDVAGSISVGGLVGYNFDATIRMCDSMATVTASIESAGGLVGMNIGEISYCYSHGQVSGHANVGGLVGTNCAGKISPNSSIYHIGDVFDSYSTATIDGYSSVGGLTGDNWGIISRCYSSGEVNGEETGGLIGTRYYLEERYPAITNDCYWDTNTSGQETSSGGEGKTTVEMQTAATFLEAGWDFVDESVNGTEDIWSICEGTNYPRLVWQIPAGDFVCPDGITIEDFVFFIEHLRDDNCDLSNDYCDGTDLDFSGTVDEADLEILVDNWLESRD